MALLATLLASLLGCPLGPRLVPAVVGLVADLATFGAFGLVALATLASGGVDGLCFVALATLASFGSTSAFGCDVALLVAFGALDLIDFSRHLSGVESREEGGVVRDESVEVHVRSHLVGVDVLCDLCLHLRVLSLEGLEEGVHDEVLDGDLGLVDFTSFGHCLEFPLRGVAMERESLHVRHRLESPRSDAQVGVLPHSDDGKGVASIVACKIGNER